MTRLDPGQAQAELSYQLLDVAEDEVFLAAASELLTAIIPSEGVAWNSVDLAAGTARLRGTPVELQAEGMLRMLAVHAGDHPIIQSYLRTDAVSAPRRMSDVASRRDLLRSGTYVDVLRPLGIHHQLSIMTTRRGALTGSGWAFSRGLRDFTDDEVSIASAVQSVLSLMTHRPVARPTRGASADRAGLTLREHQVLCLVAEGYTAQSVGRMLRIAPSTVRKHLEHVYAKLDVHDRLLAVGRARELCLI